MVELGNLQYLILMAILDLGEEAYGLRICRRLEESDQGEVVIGSVYVTLNRLEEKGYISSTESDPVARRGGRSRRIYNLTALGHEAFDFTWERHHQRVEAGKAMHQIFRKPHSVKI